MACWCAEGGRVGGVEGCLVDFIREPRTPREEVVGPKSPGNPRRLRRSTGGDLSPVLAILLKRTANPGGHQGHPDGRSHA